MKGTDYDMWQKSVAGNPANEMVQTLLSSGFSGIYIDRLGYADQGTKLEMELANALGTSPIVSTDQRLSFFDLTKIQSRR